MKYQAGVLITSTHEENFGDYYEASHFLELRPVRVSFAEVEADLSGVRSWIKREKRKEAKLQRRYGPTYRGDSWNWPQEWEDDGGFEPPILPNSSYDIHVRVVPDT